MSLYVYLDGIHSSCLILNCFYFLLLHIVMQFNELFSISGIHKTRDCFPTIFRKYPDWLASQFPAPWGFSFFPHETAAGEPRSGEHESRIK